MRPEDLLDETVLGDVDVQLLTPRWRERITAPEDLQEPICVAHNVDGSWILTVMIDGEEYELPVQEGEPEGDLEEIAPGVKAWVRMKVFGLSKLGPGVWRMDPSLWVAGELHAFLVLRDVPEPAPFAKPLLFSAAGGRLV